jgi:hypothetical protein
MQSMDAWRAVRASPSNNGLPSQIDEKSGRSPYTIHYSQSHGEPRRDNVVYMGGMWNSGLSTDNLAFLNEGQILEKEGKARGKNDVS